MLGPKQINNIKRDIDKSKVNNHHQDFKQSELKIYRVITTSGTKLVHRKNIIQEKGTNRLQCIHTQITINNNIPNVAPKVGVSGG